MKFTLYTVSESTTWQQKSDFCPENKFCAIPVAVVEFYP